VFRYNASHVLQYCGGYVPLQCVSRCISVEVMFRYSVSLVVFLWRLCFAKVCLSYCSSVDVMFRYSVSLVLQICRGYVSLQCYLSYCSSVEVMFCYRVSLILQLCRVYFSLQFISHIAVLWRLCFATVCLSLHLYRGYVSLVCLSLQF